MKKTLKLLVITLLIIHFPVIAFAQLADSTTRLVRLEGAVNFRDVGGYKTTTGTEVVRNKIFRSADISHLTNNDMQIIREKQIYTVVDFRGTKESEAAPDRLLPNTAYTLCPAGSENLPDMKEMAELFKRGDFLMTMYGTPSIQYYGDRYKPLFQQLLTLPTDEALLYHCTGGRDRTGMATALFLYALQVSTETIEADFVASNVYLKPQNENMYQPMADAFGTDVEKVKEMMMLRPELIRNFFSSIVTQYGSVEKFMEAELGIGNQELQTLREKYTN